MKSPTPLLAVALLLAAACGGGGGGGGDGITTPPGGGGQQGPPPSSAEVNMNPASFSPSSVTIASGGTVRWVNAAAVSHTITPNNPSQTGVWASQTIPAQTGAAFTHTFNVAGTFEYNCQFHAGMIGTIRVQ